eukprot:CAMPEP_0197660908 /NCGR_PEP_ID=MMETSP1338-20131121/51136_1 /TAXON_ID=43686 ORGANISM="Pelagodinium beii, Strain RCC1491" /NCGR_SAMPLE_ID=MMETSP1338 /ASSEMBLY_ACC=CAM_ASM_000754 /LENGTH=398 /DNA_ID=CAMNT_0043238361 /DNA_START=42 /DNA_END=1235 /DNA_ORIENTATION=-
MVESSPLNARDASLGLGTTLCGDFPGPPWPIFIWPLLGRSRFTFRKRSCGVPRWVLVWCGPALVAAFGFLLQNWQLHIATYEYVHVMRQYNLKEKYTPTKGQGIEDIPLTIGLSPQNVSYGSLDDPVTGMLGPYMDVNTSFLDSLALLFPVGFAVLAILTDRPYAWTRVMICFFWLAVGKGFLAWVTVEPASDGWQKCVDRLAANYDADWYAKSRSYCELFAMYPFSRLCADMMYSGHTYTVTIFAFGLFGVTREALRTQTSRYRMAAEFVVSVLAVIQQSIEIYFVLKSRFHYTADVVMAIVLTYLLYTNGAIAILTKRWLKLTKDEITELAKGLTQQSEASDNLNWLFALSTAADGRVNLGCNCGGSEEYLYDAGELQAIMDMIQNKEGLSDSERW